MSVRSIISRWEKSVKMPKGKEERFSGFGVMGLTFSSGHVLAMRKFVASSIGPAYTAVWHRNPGGEWFFYTDADLSRSCARYFGEATTEAITERVNFSWSTNNRFRIEIKNAGLKWDVVLGETVATKLMNLVARAMPYKWWKNERILSLMSAICGGLMN